MTLIEQAIQAEQEYKIRMKEATVTWIIDLSVRVRLNMKQSKSGLL